MDACIRIASRPTRLSLLLYSDVFALHLRSASHIICMMRFSVLRIYQPNKLQKLKDALRETWETETGDTGDTGEKGDNRADWVNRFKT